MAMENLKLKFDEILEEVKKEMVESEFMVYVCEKLGLRKMMDDENLEEKQDGEEGKVFFLSF